MLLPFLLAQSEIRVDLIWSTDCPVAQRWVPKVASWQAKHPQAKVIWWFPVDEPTAAKSYAKKFGLSGEILALQGSELAFEFALDRFPSTVIRRAGETVFVGGVGAQADPDSRFLLAEAYSAALSRRPMVPGRSEPQGCTLPNTLQAKPNSPVTYWKHVRPTIQQYCLPCHGPSGAAPFRLDRYPDARRWSHMILDVLQRKKMPPVRMYPRLGKAASRPAPDTDDLEKLTVWREYGAPEGTRDGTPMPSPQAKNLQPIYDLALATPTMGRFRFVDVLLPKVDRTSGYTAVSAPQGSVRMIWTFLAKSPRPGDQGERWKALPEDHEFVHASVPGSFAPSPRYSFATQGRIPLVRLLLYGVGNEKALQIQLAPLKPSSPRMASSKRFMIENGRLPSFDGAVEQTSLQVFPHPQRPYSLTVIGDPSPTLITLLGPKGSWLNGELTPNSFMPTVMLDGAPAVGQLGLNVTYGGHSLTGEKGPPSIAFGNAWNEARLEAYVVLPAQ